MVDIDKKRHEVDLNTVKQYLSLINEEYGVSAICIGVDDDDTVQWGDSLKELLGVDIEGTRFVSGALGGLFDLLNTEGFLFYNLAFDSLRTSADILESGTVVLLSPARDWLVFREITVAERKIYCLFYITPYAKYFWQVTWEKEHDHLTELLNRQAFIKESTEVCANSCCGFMIFMDLDNLKQVNDNWGHNAGDAYIVAMAEHIRGFFDKFDTARKAYGRLAGDEFAVCIGGFNSHTERDKCLEGFNDEFPFMLPNGRPSRLLFSTGVARFPEDANNVDDLLIFSDFAMNVVKKNDKGNIGFFSREEHDVFLDISRREAKLNEILTTKDISFVYVPYVNGVTGDVTVFEMFPISHVEGLRDIDEIKLVSKYYHRNFELDKVIYTAMLEEFKRLAKLDFEQVVTLGYMPQDLFYQGELENMLNATNYPSRRLCLCFDSEMRSDYDRMRRIDMAKDYNLRFGFKNFGARTSNAALEFSPHIVKLSKDLAYECTAADYNRELVKDLINFANRYGFATAAGYIATAEALSVLRDMGIGIFGGEAVFGEVGLDDIEETARKKFQWS